jgi:hypothetical protein
MDATEMKAAMVVPEKPRPQLSPMGRALVEATMPFRLFQRAAEVLEEGMEATKRKVVREEGADGARRWVKGPAVPDYTERRLAAEHVTRIGGMVTDRVEHDLQGLVAFTMIGMDRERV